MIYTTNKIDDIVVIWALSTLEKHSIFTFKRDKFSISGKHVANKALVNIFASTVDDLIERLKDLEMIVYLFNIQTL